MRNPLDAVVRNVEEVLSTLKAGNEVVVPLHLLKEIHFLDWSQFSIGLATIQHNGKSLIYILLKPEKKQNKFYKEIPYSGIGE